MPRPRAILQCAPRTTKQSSNAVARLLLAQTCRLMQRVRPQIVAESSARLLKSLFARPGFCPSPSLVVWRRPLGGNHVCQ